MATYNDGNAPYGSQVVTIGATAFIAEQISINVPSQIIEVRDEAGNPTKQVIIEQFNTGAAVLQFATTLTVPPTIGATFTMTRNGGATVGVIVSQVGEPETQFDIKKASINFRKRYN